MSTYKIHPLAALFPEMSPKDFEELKESIRTLGLQEPIITEGVTGVVIDGRNRLKACEELGIAPKFRSILFVGGAGQTIEDYIWTHNAVRRHLTDDQRAVLATQWLEALEKQAKERQAAAGKPGVTTPPRGQSAPTPSNHPTRAAIAKRANVSTKKARQAIAVKKHAPHLASKVASGEMKLKDAEKQRRASERLAERKAEEEAMKEDAAFRPFRRMTLPDAQLKFFKLLPFEAAEAAWKTAAKYLHPDRGGDSIHMTELNGLWRVIKEKQYGR